MRILVVDDEVSIHDIVSQYAKLYGHTCVGASGGYQAIELVQQQDFDCIIMDIMMPDLDGYNTTKKIKEIKDIPVLMLSAKHSEEDKLYGFQMGVDDYMTKPFSVKELIMRLNVISSRSSHNEQQVIVIEGLKIDKLGHFIEVDNKRVNLSLKEFDLLLLLVRRKNQVCTREMILNEIWSNEFQGDDRTVDTHIKQLRGQLGPYRHKIKTIRGLGYLFETTA